jgi:hypothetical protein
MIKPLLATLASATFTVLLAPPLHAADADVMHESADRAAIDALMWKYVRALDGYDPEGYASLYTSDGQFGSGTQAAKGHEALQKMIAGFKERHEAQKAKGEPTPVMHPIITNPYVEFVDADHVHFHAYWLTVFGSGLKVDKVNIAAAGMEYDELVRVGGHWLIKLRDVAPKS